ncbi:proline dehydrogenase family protein [Desulfonatronum sp. SC1]|uniref:proline dehydrogenase family protein n=1 Tax=Desulfonatronum sp. SC1 TaxID=2109626 RepID=UPI000D3063F5|nr:proline dehydrogenase family protein [Desulfonatronum sp. SC1]PTN39066.1 proline dehydrogenase [Desulfonatronum sp. SC1]
MQLWQQAMIGLARSKRVTRAMQGSTVMGAFSQRFVGGEDGKAAIARGGNLRESGISASLFYLGEYVEEPTLVDRNVAELEGVVPGLAEAGLDVHVSVDPTQAGSMISWDLCRERVTGLARTVAAQTGGRLRAVMLDMEDSSVTDRTLELHSALRDQSLPAAVTVQSYLHRTEDDLDDLVRCGAMVRLVKGAFAEPADRAFTSRKERDRSYRRCIESLFSRRAREAGAYPVLGTHDHAMIAFASEVAARNKWPRDKWEVEMLYGVRPDYQWQLVEQGYSLRLYVPFGRDWWPYSIRRVGENPRNLWFVLRSLFH